MKLVILLFTFVVDGPVRSNQKLYHLTSYGLLVLLPAGLLGFNPAGSVDMALAAIIPVHAYIGMTSVLLDYVHTKPMFSLSMLLLGGAAIASFGALVHFNLKDVGISEGLKTLWKDDKKKLEQK